MASTLNSGPLNALAVNAASVGAGSGIASATGTAAGIGAASGVGVAISATVGAAAGVASGRAGGFGVGASWSGVRWPPILPAPLISGLSYSPNPLTIKTDMDSGPARVRRRFTTGATLYKATWEFSQLQLAVFEAWWTQQAQSGAAFFSVRAWNGLGAQVISARFSEGTYSVKPIENGQWQVSATLETRDRPLLTQAQLSGYL